MHQGHEEIVATMHCHRFNKAILQILILPIQMELPTSWFPGLADVAMFTHVSGFTCTYMNIVGCWATNQIPDKDTET